MELGKEDSTVTVVLETYQFLINKVILRKGKERYEDALALWDQAIDAYPDYPIVSAYKGALLYELKRKKEAVELLEFAVRHGVLFADAYYYLGMCYLDNVGGVKKRSEVDSLFKKALQVDPQHSEAATALRKL